MELNASILDFLKGKKVAVAVSGGVDSMTLLRLFNSRGDIDFFAVNIEHGIRGEKSLFDSRFVKDYCNLNGIPLLAFSVDSVLRKKQERLTLEEAARLERRKIFLELLNSGKCDLVALAHHKNDQAETVLLRIIRGTGINGLKGMEKLSNGIVRPLLDFSREEIEEYAIKNNVPFVTDETNLISDYSRNFLRNEAIPLISSRFPYFTDSLIRLSKNAAEDEAFIAAFMREIIKSGDTAIIKEPLPHPAVLKREAAAAFRALGVYQDIEERHFDLIVSLKDAENGTRLNMPGGIEVYKENGAIAFVKSGLNKEYLEAPLPENFEGERLGVLFSLCNDKGKEKGALKFDADKVPSGAVLRYRKEGDVFKKFGGGTKSLGDYMTDKKIPLRLRDKIPVLAFGNDILFIAGVEISDKIKIDGDTKRIVKIRLIEPLFDN